MSSRNTYLNPRERKAALVLFKSLSLARQLWQDGEKDADRIRQQMTSLIQKEPLAQIDYVSIADANTLAELETIDRPALASLAVRIGKARLIDNVILE
jgi:pantoate--beta-alanine ligase